MIKERELTKEIIESGIRSIRRKGANEIIILFNDKTELEVDSVTHTLSVRKKLMALWKQEVYPYLIEFLDIWDAFRITGIPYPKMAMQYDREDDCYYYSIDREDGALNKINTAQLKIMKESFKWLYIETSYPVDCLSPFEMPGDNITGFHRYSINGRYLRFIAVISNNNLLKKLYQRYIEA